MSIFNDAYEQGQRAAFEKFAAGLSAANIRGAIPRRQGAQAAATMPGAQHPAQAGVPVMPQATAQAPASAPIGQMTGAAAAPASQQGWLQRAWGGLNRVAANPVGQMALGMGVPMLIGGMMSSNSSQQP